MDFEVLPAKGELSGKIFAYPVRVYYEDTDAGGIVYYANYLKFAERARTEFLRYFNFTQNESLVEERTGFVVRSCNIEYIASARLDDALVVTCEIIEIGKVWLRVRQQIFCGERLLTSIEVKLVHMSVSSMRPVRIPDEMMKSLENLV